MAELAGYTPDVDISFNITGLRPNEKLNEELTGGTPIPTDDPMIFADTLDPLDEQAFLGMLTDLKSVKGEEAKEFASKAASTYSPV